MTGAIWTSDEALEMLDMARKNMTVIEIAEYMGFSVASVRGFIGSAVSRKIIKPTKKSKKKNYQKDPDFKPVNPAIEADKILKTLPFRVHYAAGKHYSWSTI